MAVQALTAMAYHHQAVEDNQKRKLVQTKQRIATADQSREDLLDVPAPLGVSNETRVTRSAYGQLQGAQRRTLAIQIGKMQGNQHLQRVVGALKRDEVQQIGKHPIQREEKQTAPSVSNVDDIWVRVPSGMKHTLNKNLVLRDMLLMLYARIGASLWNHIKEITWVSERGEMDFVPVDEAQLQGALIDRGYTTAYFAKSGDNRWGLREPTLPAAGLHWRGLKDTHKNVYKVHVHIDLHPPVLTGFLHWFQDSFLRTKTHTPESIRAGIEWLGTYIPVLYQQTVHGSLTSKVKSLESRAKTKSLPAAQAEIDEAREYLQEAGKILWARGVIEQSELDAAMLNLGLASASISGAQHTLSKASSAGKVAPILPKLQQQRLPVQRTRDNSFELEATQTHINREHVSGQLVQRQTKPGATPPSEKTTDLSMAEKKLETILEDLRLKKKEEGWDQKQYTDALKSSLEAFFETDTGKKLKDFILSKRVFPFTLAIGLGALGGMAASKTDIPSTPDIPLSDNLNVKAEFEGTFDKPTGFKLLLTFTFGGAEEKSKRAKMPSVVELPPKVHKFIERIDDDVLRKWAVESTFREFELAGPDEEKDKKELHQDVKANRDMIPGVKLLAEDLARELLANGRQNQKTIVFNQLNKGEGAEELWDKLWNGLSNRFAGLYERLAWLVALLIPELPTEARRVEQINFIAGSQHLPVKTSKNK